MTLRWHAFYLTIIAALLAAVLFQGGKLQRAELAAQRQVIAEELYREIRAAPGRYQLVDLRATEEFEDGHLPHAVHVKLPLEPDAEFDRYKPTVVVTEEGDPQTIERLRDEFKVALNLEGGMLQWRMSRLPEVSGVTDLTALRRGRAG
jgi:rhodanese-related sulfurtransferase